MTKIAIQGFGGLRPLVLPRLLRDNEATVASNVRLDSGGVSGWNLAQQIAVLGGSSNKTIYSFGKGVTQRWLKWTTDVDVAKSPIEGDTTERTYYTGDGVPKMTNATLVTTDSWYALGVPAPTSPPSVSAAGLAVVGTVDGTLTHPTARISFTAGVTFGQSGKSGVRFEKSADASATQAFAFPGFVTGLKMVVDTVVDADHVTVRSADGSDGVAAGDPFTGWQVATYGVAPVTAITASLRMPNGITLPVPGHSLLAGDVIAVTEIVTPPVWTGRRGELTVAQNGSISGGFDFTPHDASGALAFDVVAKFNYSIVQRSGDVGKRYYVYTWVTNLGEEGPPSPPSEAVTVRDGQPVTVSGFGAPPSTNRVISFYRIYRSAVGTDDTDFLFQGEYSVATGSVNDGLLDVSLGEPLATDSFDPPPANLAGIKKLPNGSMVGFFENVVCFSEPGFPHAWPVEYRRTLAFKVVGLGVIGAAVVALTEGTPYVITGTHPRNVSERQLAENEACVSKTSIVTINDRVYYASPNGLCAAGMQRVDVLTNGLVKAEDWRAQYYPSTIVGANRNDRYIGFFDGGSAPTRGAFIADESEERKAWTLTNQWFRGVYTDPGSGELFVTDGTNVLRWGTGAASSYIWRSKTFALPYPANFGAVRVAAFAYPVTFRLYNAENGALIATRVINNSEPVRLPSGRLYNAVQLEVEAASNAEVLYLAIGESLDELAEG